MPTEQRVIASKPKIGAKSASAAVPSQSAAPAEETEAKGGSRKKLVMIVLAVLLLGGGAGWYFLMGPGAGAEEAAEEHAPEPGEVLTIDSININLADGHYLRIGLALQMTADAAGHGEIQAAPALDHAIALYSGRPVTEVASPEGREALKAELLHRLEEPYHEGVMDLYFTEYVTQ
ncbi:flagellar basal body-associated FliL family protein [Cellulomonas carbonis]|uniref:Flagellar protein FliL n=1 Tax=Cellulomonas carbonis T26 TaxID=947969 RepID=A0A0A0BLL5_9CELL|nr:flagellar basal body-associated FliL family protein [Cellulomonas carbonis]KGM08851.1 flagellar basal body rod protein [Cellulomonas carbonis T26]GGC01652.1 hypothetical protein GCM10010972_13110 [Cellulomonas carbonis]